MISKDFDKICDEVIATINKQNESPFLGYPVGTLRLLKAKFNEEKKVVDIEFAHDPNGWSPCWKSTTFVEHKNIMNHVLKGVK